MRHWTIALILVAVMVLGFGQVAFCGGSASFRVSCTIPAIPGVNAPATGPASADAADNANTAAEETREESEVIQEVAPRDNTNVKTVYSK